MSSRSKFKKMKLKTLNTRVEEALKHLLKYPGHIIDLRNFHMTNASIGVLAGRVKESLDLMGIKYVYQNFRIRVMSAQEIHDRQQFTFMDTMPTQSKNFIHEILGKRATHMIVDDPHA